MYDVIWFWWLIFYRVRVVYQFKHTICLNNGKKCSDIYKIGYLVTHDLCVYCRLQEASFFFFIFTFFFFRTAPRSTSIFLRREITVCREKINQLLVVGVSNADIIPVTMGSHDQPARGWRRLFFCRSLRVFCPSHHIKRLRVNGTTRNHLLKVFIPLTCKWTPRGVHRKISIRVTSPITCPVWCRATDMWLSGTQGGAMVW